MTSIFSKIIQGESPSYKIYEDEYVYAFLDINPVQKGHTLVVPKLEIPYIFDLNEELFDKVMHRVRYVAQVLKAKTNCARVCVIIEGYQIPHAHIHLIPTNQESDLDRTKAYKATDEELKAMYELLAC